MKVHVDKAWAIRACRWIGNLAVTGHLISSNGSAFYIETNYEHFIKIFNYGYMPPHVKLFFCTKKWFRYVVRFETGL